MKTIRWGMIGCGDVTEVKSGPGFYQSERSALLGVSNRTLDKAHSYARRHGVPRVYPEVSSLLADREIDAVYIAVPPVDHKALTLQAAAAGKHIYVEKPMGINHAECQEMIAACAHSGVRLYVAFYRRAMPRFIQVKKWIDEDAIGAVCAVSVLQRQKPALEELSPDTLPWRVRGEISGGGKFLDMGAHVLDALIWWFGPITEVHGVAGNRRGLYPVEDTVSACWRHASGVSGAGSWCYVCDDEADRIIITGTRGRIEFGFFSDAPLNLHREGSAEEVHIPNPPHVQQPLIQSVVDELCGIRASLCDIHAAAMVSAVTDRILGKSSVFPA
ncbi:MAG: Gfo/Idh/MocA family oxidoreductase [Azoarcus sp.]|jgi:predicted dehydrogenase|nr:Gfo/Idh/MocA family oxidoreductase [Azoarcus sp.]